MMCFLPRFGVLAVFLPPRILKKPFPKDERAFLEPKLLSSTVAPGVNVAEGPIGGFSLVLPMSSLLFLEEKKQQLFMAYSHIHYLPSTGQL